MYKLNITNQFANCKNYQNIIFTRAYKGNITVVLDKDSYIQKIEDLLNDDNTYTVIIKNPIQFVEKNLFKNWLQKDYISKQQYYKLFI